MVADDQSIKIEMEAEPKCSCGALLDEDEKLLEDGLCCACWLKTCREA